jgi:hypothetical protein
MKYNLIDLESGQTVLENAQLNEIEEFIEEYKLDSELFEIEEVLN